MKKIRLINKQLHDCLRRQELSMSRILSPYSLKPQDFTPSSRTCDDTKLEVPLDFIEDYFDIPPLWLITIGYPQHGKTVFLSALTLVIEKLGGIWPDTHRVFLNDDTRDRVMKMREAATTGAVLPPTGEPQDNIIRPLLIQIKNIPTVGSYCAVMYDVQGESFLRKKNIRQIEHILKKVNTLWFIVSLKDLEAQPKYTISDMFDTYRELMREMGVKLKDRNLIVIYTKSDLYEFNPDVEKYIYSDPLKGLTYRDTTETIPRKFNITEYAGYMQDVSDKLEKFTSTLNIAGDFISKVRGERMNLKFCAVSALGHNPDTETSGKSLMNAMPYRVLDPFLWATLLYTPSDIEDEPIVDLFKQFFALVLDNSAATDIFTQDITKQIWGLLSNSGSVVTYVLGNHYPVAVELQPPPNHGKPTSKSPLIGSILDPLGSQKNACAVILTGTHFLDLKDYQDTEWEDRLVIVALADITSEWKNLFFYRDERSFEALVNYLSRWIQRMKTGGTQ